MPAPVHTVVGLDVGGTSTTAGVMAADGALLSVVEGPGANFRSSPGSVAEHVGSLLAAVVARVQERLGGTGWTAVAVVAGVAGAGPAGRERAVTLLERATAASGLPTAAAPEVVTDPVVAYAAGAPGPDGVLLLAGTGAVALRVAGFAERARSDGLGWLLGDVGSGVWLALAGLRAAAADLDGRGPATALTPAAAAFAAAAGAAGTGDPRQDLVRLTDLRSPAQLGAFAREVTACAAGGDAVASGIVAEGVAGLLRSLSVVADGATDVVLAGSVLTGPGPVRDGVLAALGRPGQGFRVHDAAAPVVGALRLAADRAGWPLSDPAVLTAAVQAVRG